MAHIVRRRWAQVLWWAYAPVVTFVVVATANHWWLDGFLGAVVALAAALCAHGCLRPGAARRVGVERSATGDRAAIVFAP